MKDNNRSRRYGEAAAATSATQMRPARILRTGPRRTPDTNSMASATQPSTMAVPKSGCAIDQHAGAACDQEQRPDDPSIRRSLVEPLADQIGGKDRQRQFHQLRWLEPELAEADPSARALHVHPEPGYQDHEEEQEGDAEQERAQSAEFAVIEADRQRERDDAYRHPQAFPDEDRPRTAVERNGDHRRGGSDHHQPDHAEQRNDHEEDRSGGEFGHRGTQPCQGASPFRLRSNARVPLPRAAGRAVAVAGGVTQ